MKKIIWAIIVIVIIVLIVLGLQNNRNNEGSIKIGVIAPLTGWGAYWGEGYIKGVQLAVEEIKSNGGDLKVIIEDGATDALKSASVAQKLINIDNVGALTVEFTGPSSSVIPLSKEDKIPVIYDSLVKKFIDDNPYAFKWYFDIGKQCSVAAEYLAKQGHKNIGVFSVNLDFLPECESSVQKIAQKYGTKVSIYSFNIDDIDFRTIITKMKNDKIDSVIPVFYEDHAISFFKQKEALNLNTPIFMGIGIPDGFTEKVRQSVTSTSIEGVITYDQPISSEFIEKIKSKYPSITEKDFVPAAYGYDEIYYLYNSLSKCKYKDIDCVISKMKKDSYKGAVGSSGFGEDRVLDMFPVYYQYKGGDLIEISI